MKTKKTIFLITVFLVSLVFSFHACKREAVNRPDPFGPSSFAILLNLKANPNVLFAGLNSRQTSAITATLTKYDGTAIPDKTIFFETVDGQGNRLDLGYFEGNQALLAKNTDGSGTVTTNYYGPLSGEVGTNLSYYIRATVGMEGSQFIFERVPLYIICDQVTFTAYAVPDLLYASCSARPNAEIRAQVLAGSTPLVNYPVYFIIENDIGKFEDGKKSTYKLTNAEGLATIIYKGPSCAEIAGDVDVYIKVQLTESVYKELTIHIIEQK